MEYSDQMKAQDTRAMYSTSLGAGVSTAVTAQPNLSLHIEQLNTLNGTLSDSVQLARGLKDKICGRSPLNDSIATAPEDCVLYYSELPELLSRLLTQAEQLRATLHSL